MTKKGVFLPCGEIIYYPLKWHKFIIYKAAQDGTHPAASASVAIIHVCLLMLADCFVYI